MPLINRYQQILQGCLVVTGNAFGVRQPEPFPSSSSEDYVSGSYISTNTSLVADLGFPPGTSFHASDSSSTAVLNIMPNSTVVYAQLFWICSPVDSSVDTNAPINFITPAGYNLIYPDTSQSQDDWGGNYRTRNVTSIVNAAGSGTYQVGNVPGLDITNYSSVSGACWSLVVVYKNSALPFRFISINLGYSLVDTFNPSDYSFSIITPASGTVKGYLLTTETHGDLLDGAQIWIGPTQPSSVQVGNSATGSWNNIPPYAQINNMLPGNILIADCNDPNIGLLDMRGSFGSYNKDPFAVTAPPFARVNTDILGIDISSVLTNNQTSLFTRVSFIGSGGAFVTSHSVQVDINSANLNPIKSVDKQYANVGDILTYNIVFKNTGLLNADNVVLIDTIPTGSTFQTGSVYINGFNNPSAYPTIPNGITLGTIAPNVSTTVSFKVKVSSTIPNVNPLNNKSQLTYSFVPYLGQPTQYVDTMSNSVTTQINNVTITSSKQVNKNYATIGDLLTYTIPLVITGNVSASNVVFIDTIPNGATLVSGSLKVNGTPVVGSPNPPGLSLGTLPSNATTTISYQLSVTTVPSPNPIQNFSTTKYNYIVDPSTPVINSSSSYASSSSTQINYANFSTMTKLVDKYFITCGDTINYTIIVPNTGNSTASNIIVKDTIPSGTIFIANSIKLDGVTIVSANIQNGVTIPSIGPGATSTVTFSVKVQC